MSQSFVLHCIEGVSRVTEIWGSSFHCSDTGWRWTMVTHSPRRGNWESLYFKGSLQILISPQCRHQYEDKVPGKAPSQCRGHVIGMVHYPFYSGHQGLYDWIEV